MYQESLQQIDHVAIWPLLSLGIFFLFFLVLLWWVFTVKPPFIQKMKNLPLDDTGHKS